jgi:erythromycin esterase-like protein
MPMGQIQGTVLPIETEIPERKQYLSWSQISEQMRCEYRREKRYGQRLYPRVKRRALSLGSATHLGLAHTILTREKDFTVEERLLQWAHEQSVNLLDEEMENLDEVVATATNITERALKNI